MKVAIAADHGGFALKGRLMHVLDTGHEVLDLGTHSEEPVDYPDYARALGRAILDGRAERGVLICGSGAGATIAANQGVLQGRIVDDRSGQPIAEAVVSVSGSGGETIATTDARGRYALTGDGDPRRSVVAALTHRWDSHLGRASDTTT